MRRLIGPFVVAVCLAATAVSPVAAQPSDLDSEELISAAYLGLHGRSAGPAEIAYWSDFIENGVSPGRVIAEIGDSPEHRRHVVTMLYARILDRRPDDAGLDYWSAGLVDLLTADALAREMLSSEEFYLRAGGTDRDFVAALYRTLLNREPEPAGWDYWSGLMADGVSRRAVANEFLRSAEGLLQPELSLEESEPVAGSEGSVATIRIDVDRDVVVEASAVLVAVDGIRIDGTLSPDPEDLSVVTFEASGPVPTSGNVVVTVLATSESPGGVLSVERVDFAFSAGPVPEPPVADPTGELIIAFYGHPRAPVLGVAGEGTPDQALQRLLAQAEPYGVTGRPLVPAFELISTLVTASPGPDGLYRSRATDAELRTYLDVIRTVDGRLILDIQPGRADVLDEAQAYESLLIEPEVGLALDPEWVVGPNQTPKGRIGTLDASDINRVSAYLNQLVTANDLPPKILIIHSFKPDMVTNTDQIESPPGVRILFHA
ncbi:MAG: DUF4214 domain-containing protein, partial [Acidimicrobiales bacterium]